MKEAAKKTVSQMRCFTQDFMRMGKYVTEEKLIFSFEFINLTHFENKNERLAHKQHERKNN